MALDTISLSDIGQSLLAIEAEIKTNKSSIAYHQEQIAAYHMKNETLKGIAQALLEGAIPVTLSY